jgi:hypothetical protein
MSKPQTQALKTDAPSSHCLSLFNWVARPKDPPFLGLQTTDHKMHEIGPKQTADTLFVAVGANLVWALRLKQSTCS